MSKYEMWAIILSIIAIIIPFIQWIWKKWIVRPVLNFYPTGRAYLFINKSGSYIQVEGVYEALRKPISIKNISVQIIRKKDNAIMNHHWSTFTNPSNQRLMGAYTSSMEIAHPFRIDADSIVCAFTEFSDFYNSSAKSLQPYFDAVSSDVNNMNWEGLSSLDAYIKYCELSSYKQMKEALYKECFWEISQYELIITAEYEKKKKEFKYVFEVSKEASADLNHNMEEVLGSCLYERTGISGKMKVVQVELKPAD